MRWLLDMLPRLATVVVVTFGVSFVWALGARLLARWDKPLRESATAGSIRPWPPIWWLMALFFLSMFLIAAGGVFYNSLWWLLGVLLFGVLAWYSMLTGLPVSALRWDERGVEGLSSRFGVGRRTVSWNAIAKTGVSGGGYYFVQDHRSDRVYWSYCYIGHWRLWEVMLQKRPDLEINVRETLSTPVG